MITRREKISLLIGLAISLGVYAYATAALKPAQEDPVKVAIVPMLALQCSTLYKTFNSHELGEIEYSTGYWMAQTYSLAQLWPAGWEALARAKAIKDGGGPAIEVCNRMVEPAQALIKFAAQSS